MTKEQAGKLLDEESLLTEWYEAQGLTTSDAQGASSAVMVKKYGLDGLGALNKLERNEARALLRERE
jgi:hypothetical protein